MKGPSGILESMNYKLSANNIGFASKNEDGATELKIQAVGSADNGDIKIEANGLTKIEAGNALLAIGSKNDGVATLDAGSMGIAQIAAGNPAVPQTITLDSKAASIDIQNGPIPVCPLIKVGTDSIKLSVGPNSIEIGPQGIKIAGLMIDINGSIQTNIAGTMINVKGSAMTSVAGGLIKIG